MSVRSAILKAQLRERVAHDLGPLRGVVARGAFEAARAALATGNLSRKTRAFAWLMRLHGGALSPSVDRRIAKQIRQATALERSGQATGLFALYEQVVDEAVKAWHASANADPHRLIGSRILVVKAWRPGERGALLVDYSHVFPLLAGLFDLKAIAERYSIVLEPSWTGLCTPEILNYGRLEHPVLVQTVEPRDREFIESLETSLKTVAVAPNWWVDHRSSPRLGAERDIDIIMVAAWAAFKRHWSFFHALSELRRRGHRFRVALVGYRYDLTRADIEDLARHFGVHDQIEMYERIPPEEVAALLARSKVHVLWSRREGANRAIIEAMLADVPVIVREGLSFGYKYPYINEQTGAFATERGLPEAILSMIDQPHRYSPRAWVLENMTAERATAVVERRLRDLAEASGSPWTEGLVVRTSGLDTQKYWNASDRSRFEADYQFLTSSLRRR